MDQWHTVCECPMLAEREYKRRHDWVGRKIHREVSKKIGFDVNEKWYKHESDKVVENDSWTILWNFTIQTDHVNQVTRPDMVIIVKIKNECKIILTLQAPLIAKLKRGRKITMIAYNSLKRELKKIWDMPLKVISIVVGVHRSWQIVYVHTWRTWNQKFYKLLYLIIF